MDKDVDEILKKYSRKIEEEINNPYANTNASGGQGDSNIEGSKDYLQFKQDMMPELSKYERWARGLGNFVKIKLAIKDEEKIRKQLETAHLEASPSEVAGLAIISFLITFFVGILISFAAWLLGFGFPFLFLFLMFVASFFLFYYFYTMPSRLAVKWRLKAGSQMVPAILYTVVYMKHTSNLERAISFVAQHIDPPLALDLKKVIWDVETGKYSNIKDSLDVYLDSWRENSMEFVESFHLIESSLYEPEEVRRVEILERALRVILDGVYEKMLKYTHEIKSPLTNLYMLGIVLPTLGLALLPLASTLLTGMIKWSHVFVLFNLIIPFFVFYLTANVMMRRPGGHGESSLLERNPLYYQYVNKGVYVKAGLICLPFLLLGLLPLYYPYLANLVGWQTDIPLSSIGMGLFGTGDFFGYIKGNGPFGFGALILSLFVPFSIAMFFALSFSLRTKELIKTRDQSRELEKEFNNSLFSLANRLGDGTPAELAFSKVAESSKGQKTENFFRIVHTNIQSMGMGLEEAIFSPKRGALVYYPSNLIAISMRILIESVKKGLKVAAQSLMSISEYVRNIEKINERLRDLLADVVSDMKSNMTFLAPLLAGIVVGLAAMITGILGQLNAMVGEGLGETSIADFGNVLSITSLFDIVYMIPPYFMQVAIGIYIVEIIFILTGTLVVVDAGEDKLRKTHEIGRNLIRGSILYLITALISIVALSLLASVALGGLAG
ncbi:MAG: hypothetical protein PHH54_04145 [Candidatus Nanoarchaeia archaeon]|nr:hypothetical protein [Candidatus Nanoarchaeia archaeon]MDD5741151.1 hypothetical protein [Candidatus Nanoarchaeia archaeon]